MNSRGSPLPKLSRPRLHDAIPRERLFARLDAARTRPMIWISGPPGAGKTSLVGSYMESRALSELWYQVDPGDLDIATFFYFLAEAAERGWPGTTALPLLTQEYRADIPGFSRRWFRDFFSRAAFPTLLVFDNFQDASPSPLDAVLAAAIAEVPDSSSIVIVSREDPPPALARAMAHGELAMVSWNEIKLTIDEAMDVAMSKGVSERATVEAVFGQCEGWVAGLTLMLERVRHRPSPAALGTLDSLETVFGYFAGLIFEGLDEEARRDLVLCGYLPSVTLTQAELLTGNAAASRLLEQLYRRHLFVTRRVHAEPVYEFHALFRTFLRTRASLILSPHLRRQAIARAARLLMEARQESEAVTLCVEIEDWDTIEATILDRATSLLAQGRGQTVRDWVGVLPPERIDARPMIRYWLGSALIPVDQPRARALLTDAYECLRDIDDFDGQVAAASAVVETYFFSFSGYGELRQWTDRLARLLAQPTRFGDECQRLEACGSYLLAAVFGDGTHPDLPRYVEEIRQRIRSTLDPRLRFRTGIFLVTFAGATLNPQLVVDDLDLLDGLSRLPGVSPLRLAQWQHRYALICYQVGDFETALHRVATGRQLCEQFGLRAPVSLLRQLEVFVLVGQGRHDDAFRGLAEWEALLSSERPVERSQWNVARLMTLMGSGERRDEWCAIAESVAAQMDATGQTWIRVVQRTPGAYALTECGQFTTTRRWIDDLRTLMAGSCFTRFERDVLLVEANLAWHEGRVDDARAKVRAALEWCRASRVPLQSAQNAQVHARLLGLVSGEDDDARLAATLMAQYGLRRFGAEVDGVPPPIRVMVLGGFEIVVDGQPLVFRRKQQQRPLAVLKVLATHGAGAVSANVLAEALWPDAEGDAASNALKVALHRLRKLLGRDTAIEMRHGTLTLAGETIWTDVREFDRLLEEANRHRHAGRMAAFEATGLRALSLYRGQLLPAEEPQPWLVAARDRFAQKARQLVLGLGAQLETTGSDERAASLYESGLEIDPLSETLYQRLMAIHLRHGRHALAIQAFRRCRELLSVVLGIPPSAETQALFRLAQDSAIGEGDP